MKGPSTSRDRKEAPTSDTEELLPEYNEKTPKTTKLNLSIHEDPVHKMPIYPRMRKFPSLIHSSLRHELEELEKSTGIEGQEKLPQLLIDCVKENMADFLMNLLTKGHKGVPVNLNFQDCHGRTPLHAAAEMGHLKTCELILDYGKVRNLNLGDCEGLTPLALACKNRHNNVVKLLVRSGAELNTQDIQGNTPLHYIMKTRNKEILSCLLWRDADLTLRNIDGMTPIDIAKVYKVNDQVCVMNVVQTPC